MTERSFQGFSNHRMSVNKVSYMYGNARKVKIQYYFPMLQYSSDIVPCPRHKNFNIGSLTLNKDEGLSTCIFSLGTEQSLFTRNHWPCRHFCTYQIPFTKWSKIFAYVNLNHPIQSNDIETTVLLEAKRKHCVRPVQTMLPRIQFKQYWCSTPNSE